MNKHLHSVFKLKRNVLGVAFKHNRTYKRAVIFKRKIKVVAVQEKEQQIVETNDPTPQSEEKVVPFNTTKPNTYKSQTKKVTKFNNIYTHGRDYETILQLENMILLHGRRYVLLILQPTPKPMNGVLVEPGIHNSANEAIRQNHMTQATFIGMVPKATTLIGIPTLIAATTVAVFQSVTNP